ncbi:methionine aminotransferase [Maribacter vaceletii]|uniref:Methionine aminotransferase n=1 Tax=Maribacter vaceletii TaxID=1206816 RepID=A0A495ECU4_9FLAO|nr:methionine aminotransferase [Maribacter vaceletii]RKR14710.1 methionine aminotransferase [Maribacter vaceletii]
MSSKKLSITSKLPSVKTTIFTSIGQLAKKYNAINLSQGFPNFNPDFVLLDKVTKAMQNGYNQYAPMAGDINLRETISHKIQTLYNQNYNPETEITITAGATQAIFTAITAFVSLGDEVIVIKPAYDSYEPSIIANGGIPVHVSLSAKTYKIDWDVFKSKITSKTKMVIINTPHNPTGTILTKEDMQSLEKILFNTNIIVLSDEVYEHIIFDNEIHQSVARFNNLANRSIICSSFGKTFHITGWKIGYCVGPKELMNEFRKTHQFNVFSTHHPSQIALTSYLQNEETYNSLPTFYQKKRDFFVKELEGSKFKILPCKGTYFQLLDYSNITQEQDVSFAERLIKEHKIASIPISVFNENNRDDKVLRFCFAKTEDILLKASEILNKL